MTPEQALACIEQERLDVLAEGQTEEDCNMIAAYVLASAYRRLLAARSETRESIIEEVAKAIEAAPLTYAGPDPQGVRDLRYLIVSAIRDLKGA